MIGRRRKNGSKHTRLGQRDTEIKKKIRNPIYIYTHTEAYKITHMQISNRQQQQNRTCNIYKKTRKEKIIN